MSGLFKREILLDNPISVGIRKDVFLLLREIPVT